MLLEIVNKATLPNLNVKFNSSVLVLSFYEIKSKSDNVLEHNQNKVAARMILK